MIIDESEGLQITYFLKFILRTIGWSSSNDTWWRHHMKALCITGILWRLIPLTQG